MTVSLETKVAKAKYEGEKKNALTITSDIKVSEMGPLEPGPAQTPRWERTDWHMTEAVSKSWFVVKGIFC